MKARNLQIMQRKGLNVPAFKVLDGINCTNVPDGIDMKFSTSEYFAVRSSSYSEDGLRQSHAGEFKTILNVPRDKVLEAVKDVAKGYGSIPGQIIIQEMIDSDISGVIFTANPLGVLSQMCISVGTGTGDNVVDNKVRTTTYIYDLEEEQIYEVENAHDYKDNKDNKEEGPKISSNTLHRLISLGLEIDRLFNTKCDIEFAVKDDVIYILQSRPITTLKNKSIVLDNSNIVESYPGISLPLTQDFVKDIYYGIFKQLVNHLTGTDTYKIGKMVTCVNWHFYYIISDWYTLLLKLPFSKKIIGTWQQMLGVSNKEITFNNDKVDTAVKIRVAINFIKALFRNKHNMTKLNNSFDYRIKQYRDRLKTCDTKDELFELYSKAKKDFLADWYVTLINDMYTFIFTGLVKNKDYISNMRDMESRKQTEALNMLAYEYSSKNTPEAALNSHRTAYIEKYGDRVPGELKLETETFRTNNNKLDEYLKSIHKTELTNSNNIKISAGILQRIFISKAKIGIINREISRFNRSRLFGFIRDLFLKIGRILVEEGKLSNQKDIFYIFEDEIKHIDCLNDIVADRKLLEITFSNCRMPHRIKIDKAEITEIQSELIDNKSNGIGELYSGGNRLSGEVVSRAYGLSEITGKVIVMERPNLNIDTTDRIVVTSITDPGWSAIIKNSKAVITEQGSLLSHTAIISRELGKPAIVNVRNITRLLHTDDTISLNTNTGIIKIIAG